MYKNSLSTSFALTFIGFFLFLPSAKPMDIVEDTGPKASVTLVTTKIDNPVLSFDEWQQKLLMINEPWAYVMWERLTVLDLKELNIGNKGVKIFVDGLPNFSNLTSLNLDNNSIGDEGAIFLSTTPFLKNLTSLNLGVNSIGDEGAIALARHPNLISLSINHNNIGLTGAQALANNTTLTTLIMQWNKAGDEGAEAFSTNTTLTTLLLGCNDLHNRGAIALARNSTLTALNLKRNEIGTKGAAAFIDNTTLLFLDLDKNLGISNDVGRKLREAFSANPEIIREVYVDDEDIY